MLDKIFVRIRKSKIFELPATTRRLEKLIDIKFDL